MLGGGSLPDGLATGLLASVNPFQAFARTSSGRSRAMPHPSGVVPACAGVLTVPGEGQRESEHNRHVQDEFVGTGRQRPGSRAGACAERIKEPRPRPGPGMAWIPGGTFRMGSADFYPEERPVHRVTVDGFWMDAIPVTVAAVPAVRRGDRLRDGRGAAAGRGRLPGCRSGPAGAGIARLPPHGGPGRPARLPQLVGVRPRRMLAAPDGPGSDCRGRDGTPSPTSPTKTRRPMQPGPARNCPPRPSGSSRPAAASTAPSSRGATSSRPAAR